MTTPRRLRLTIWHPAYGDVGPVQQFTDFSATLKRSDVGKWFVAAPVTDRNLFLLEPGAAIYARDPALGRIVVSGPVTTPRVIVNEKYPNGYISVDGVTHEQFLADTITYPDSSRRSIAQTTREQWVMTGQAGGVIKALAMAQCGNSALVDNPSLTIRKSALTLVAEPNAGSTITIKTRFENLLDVMQQAAVAGGVGFNVLGRENLVPALSVTAPRDLSASVVLSAQRRSLRRAEWWRNAPKATVVTTGGQGEGTARYIDERLDFNAQLRWNRRIETFRDQRGETDATKIADDTQTELIDNGETAAVKFEARDVPRATCGVDYWLGDIIRAILTPSNGVTSGADVTAEVREISITQGKIAPIYSPIIGEGGATNTPAGRLAVDRLQRRLRYLEGGAR